MSVARKVQVAIVGAGPTGLTLSALLSRYGVTSLVLEKGAALPTHPQAHPYTETGSASNLRPLGALAGAPID